jgi:hypothetical protein
LSGKEVPLNTPATEPELFLGVSARKLKVKATWAVIRAVETGKSKKDSAGLGRSF